MRPVRSCLAFQLFSSSALSLVVFRRVLRGRLLWSPRLSGWFFDHLPPGIPGFTCRLVLGAAQGRQDLNLQPSVLETGALPVELRPYV